MLLVVDTVANGQGVDRSLRVWVGKGEARVHWMWVSPDGAAVVVSITTPTLAEVCTGRRSNATSGPSPSTRTVTCTDAPILLLSGVATLPASAMRVFVDRLGTDGTAAGTDTLLKSSLGLPVPPAQSGATTPQRQLQEVSGGAAGANARSVNAVSCPPACPQPPGPGRGLPGALTSRAAEADAWASSAGVSVVDACPGSFTDPLLGTCGNGSVAASFQCAWGAGDDCALCPYSLVCPGGYRVRSRPGYWVPSQGVNPDQVVPCSSPSTDRCRGWDGANSRTQCGAGYRPGSYGCSLCDVGRYPDDEGVCLQCPNLIPGTALPVPNFGLAVVAPIGTFVASLLAFGALVFCAMAYLTRREGGFLRRSALRTSEFMVWTFTAVQLLVQMMQSAPDGLPAFIREVYTALGVLQFQGIALHPDCFPGQHFQAEWAAFGTIAVAYALLIILPLTSGRCRCPRPPRLRKAQRAVVALLCAIYATISNLAWDVLSCTDTQLSVRTYLALNQDGGALRKAGLNPTALSVDAVAGGGDAAVLSPSAIAERSRLLATIIPARLLRNNAAYVCGEGAHGQVQWAALTLLVLFVAAFPLSQGVVVSAYIRRVLEQAGPALRVRAGKDASKRCSLLQATRASLVRLFLGTLPTSLDDTLAKRRRVALKLGTAAGASTDLVAAVSAREAAVASLTHKKLRSPIETAVDDLPRSTHLPHASILLGAYLPSAYYFVVLDMSSLVVSSALQAFMEDRATVATAVARCAALVATSCAMALAYTAVRPFPRMFAWKQAVTLYILAVSALQAVLSLCQDMLNIWAADREALEGQLAALPTAAVPSGPGSATASLRAQIAAVDASIPPMQLAVNVLAVGVVIAMCGLFVTLLLAFFLTLRSGSRHDKLVSTYVGTAAVARVPDHVDVEGAVAAVAAVNLALAADRAVSGVGRDVVVLGTPVSSTLLSVYTKKGSGGAPDAPGSTLKRALPGHTLQQASGAPTLTLADMLFGPDAFSVPSLDPFDQAEDAAWFSGAAALDGDALHSNPLLAVQGGGKRRAGGHLPSGRSQLSRTMTFAPVPVVGGGAVEVPAARDVTSSTLQRSAAVSLELDMEAPSRDVRQEGRQGGRPSRGASVRPGTGPASVRKDDGAAALADSAAGVTAAAHSSSKANLLRAYASGGAGAGGPVRRPAASAPLGPKVSSVATPTGSAGAGR